MNYTKLVSKRKQYKYSANICFDLRDEERLSSFIPNITTTEILREYLGGMIRENTNTHSRILYGSYGTGKSHLLTVMSAVLGQINTDSNGFKTFVNLISKYDQELAADVKNFSKEKNPYLIVPVYSDYDDFGKCISFSVKKELDRNNIRVTFKGYFDEALELVEKWSEGEDSSDRLEGICSKISLSVTDLKKGLSSYDGKYEKIFEKVYSNMTYGAEFISSNGNLIDNLNSVNEAIRGKYRGIVIVFDEFGRYVEDYGEKLKVKTVQDLAEYCDHSGNNNHLILVSHKQLSLYTEKMKKSISDEWKKVEGRFKATSINIKYDQCLSLIGNIIPKNDLHWQAFKNRNEKNLNELYDQAWDFKGFMLPPEFENGNPFEDGFPLHPISLFALDRLSKKVAQNERTFFTYLAGDEPNSLFGQLEKFDVKGFHFIGLDALFDYFELNIKSFKTDEAYDIYKKLQYSLNKLGADSDEYQIKILKTLAVISIIGDSEVLIPDRNTLMSVIDGKQSDVSEAIDKLEQKKIIKYMRQYGYYDYFDSSIFDLEEMIEDRIADINDDMVLRILNEEFVDFPLYPYRYNEQYYVNRVFIPLFSTKEDLGKKTFYNTLPKYYDGAVVFVLDDHVDEKEYVSLSKESKRIILIVNGQSEIVRDEVKRYIALQYYYSIKDELAKDDPTVVSEIKLYLNEQKAIVEELIRKWRSLKDTGSFVVTKGKRLNIESDTELSEALSDIMDKSFNKTPMVKNDLLNKNSITSVIKTARRKALENIMGQDDVYEGIAFLSPEYNIIRATLSRNGLIDNNTVSKDNRINEDVFNRLPSNEIAGYPIMDTIRSILKNAENKKYPLEDLYKALKSEPFGLRDGYIPVLVAYALRDYQNVSLYFHGTEHSYSSEELVKALTEAENYSLFICNWDAIQSDYIASLETLFSDYLIKGDGLNRLEELFLAMNAHYSSITKSARTTELYVSDASKKYRDILNVSYKDYNAFFFEVLPSINSDLQELVLQLSIIKTELEDVEYKQQNRLLYVIRQELVLDEKADLMQCVENLYSNSWKNKSQKAFDYTTNAVLEVMSKAHSLDEASFVLEMAKAVTGFELSYWNDNKIDDFAELFRESINKLEDYNPKEGLSEGEIKITIESYDGVPVTTQFTEGDLSVTGQMMLNKLSNTLNDFGDSISYEEKISIITEIIKKTIN